MHPNLYLKLYLRYMRYIVFVPHFEVHIFYTCIDFSCCTLVCTTICTTFCTTFVVHVVHSFCTLFWGTYFLYSYWFFVLHPSLYLKLYLNLRCMRYIVFVPQIEVHTVYVDVTHCIFLWFKWMWSYTIFEIRHGFQRVIHPRCGPILCQLLI